MPMYILASVIGVVVILAEMVTLSADWRRTLRVVFATLALFAAFVAVLYLLDHPMAIL